MALCHRFLDAAPSSSPARPRARTLRRGSVNLERDENEPSCITSVARPIAAGRLMPLHMELSIWKLIAFRHLTDSLSILGVPGSPNGQFPWLMTTTTTSSSAAPTPALHRPARCSPSSWWSIPIGAYDFITQIVADRSRRLSRGSSSAWLPLTD